MSLHAHGGAVFRQNFLPSTKLDMHLNCQVAMLAWLLAKNRWDFNMSGDCHHKPATSTAVAAETCAQDAARGKKPARPVQQRAGKAENPIGSHRRCRGPARLAKRRKNRGRKLSWGDRWSEAFGAGACEFVSLTLDVAQEDEPLDWDFLSEEDKLTFSCKRKAP